MEFTEKNQIDMLSIEEITKYLENTLSQSRFSHTLGVAETARNLAQKWGADEDAAYLAGLVHDCAKEIDKNEAIGLLEERGYTVDEVEKKALGLLHAPLGAFLARERFGITNEEILDSIKFHTTGRVGMTLLDKIIYVADFIEPGRKYKESQLVRETAEVDIDAAVLQEANIIIKYTIDKGRLLHANTVAARNSFLGCGEEK